MLEAHEQSEQQQGHADCVRNPPEHPAGAVERGYASTIASEQRADTPQHGRQDVAAPAAARHLRGGLDRCQPGGRNRGSGWGSRA